MLWNNCDQFSIDWKSFSSVAIIEHVFFVENVAILACTDIFSCSPSSWDWQGSFLIILCYVRTTVNFSRLLETENKIRSKSFLVGYATNFQSSQSCLALSKKKFVVPLLCVPTISWLIPSISLTQNVLHHTSTCSSFW